MPYSDVLLRRSPCMPGGGFSRSIGHFGLKHRSPLRNSFIWSRRHILQTGSVFLAMGLVSHGSGVSWPPHAGGPLMAVGSPLRRFPGEPQSRNGESHNNVEDRIEPLAA